MSASGGVAIRPAIAGDAPAIAAVHVASWQATYHGLLPAAEIARHTLERRLAMWTRMLAAASAAPVAAAAPVAPGEPVASVAPAAPVAPRPATVFVATAADRLVGFANSGPFRVDASAAADPSMPAANDGELYALYLLPEMQGLGIGRRLFDAAADECRASGRAAMRCWVLDGNPAVGFYERLGGVRIATKTFRVGGDSTGIDVIEHGYRFELVHAAGATPPTDPRT